MLSRKQLEIIDECLEKGCDVELQKRREGIVIIESRKKVYKTAGNIPETKQNKCLSKE